MPAKVSILLLTEDRSKQARPALEKLSRKMISLVVPETAYSDVEFDPIPNESESIAAASDNWTGDKEHGHRHRVVLAGTIATHVLRDRGIVFFHYDAEDPWSRWSKSVRRQKFAGKLRNAVAQSVTASKRARAVWPNGVPAAELARIQSRIIELVPAYSIEAWYYRATSRAIELCHEHCDGHDADIFEDWAANPAKLEEQLSPRKHVRLGNQHNETLAGAFHAERVAALGLSFAQAVKATHACEPLVTALRPDPAQM